MVQALRHHFNAAVSILIQGIRHVFPEVPVRPFRNCAVFFDHPLMHLPYEKTPVSNPLVQIIVPCLQHYPLYAGRLPVPDFYFLKDSVQGKAARQKVLPAGQCTFNPAAPIERFTFFFLPLPYCDKSHPCCPGLFRKCLSKPVFLVVEPPVQKNNSFPYTGIFTVCIYSHNFVLLFVFPAVCSCICLNQSAMPCGSGQVPFRIRCGHVRRFPGTHRIQ